MNDSKYRWALYLISAVMLVTLGIQGYWNYKNYQTGKQQLINDVQTSFDNAINNYYTDLAKGNVITGRGSDSLRIVMGHRFDTISNHLDSTFVSNTDGFLFQTSPNGTSLIKSTRNDSTLPGMLDSIVTSVQRMSRFRTIDSLAHPVEMLSSKIIVSITQDSLSLKSIDGLIREELLRKNISIDYGLSIDGNFTTREELRPELIAIAKLNTKTESPFFFNDEVLKIHFSNITLSILKRNFVGIFLSLLLISGIFSCLLYLLKIIKQQKQLAEVKNDLISNITHEFKTPLATIGVAMEGISQYNSENDVEKTLRYANISKEQVNKLNTMVEKLLETATLDSERLNLNFEEIDLVNLLRKSTLTENLVLENKTIDFSASEETILKKVDVFHFENAINNIIDNAIKYGGDQISVVIKKQTQNIEITISDNGNGISEADKKQVFEKFYRIPKGNTHDVKGFGIGLYYTKKIVEKHHGTITVLTKSNTAFKISLPIE